MVLCLTAVLRAAPVDALHAYEETLDSALVDHYADPAGPATPIAAPAELLGVFDPTLRQSIETAAAATNDLPGRVGTIRGALQQAVTLRMVEAVQKGDLVAARLWRCELTLPRGVSAVEGSLLLDVLGAQPDKRGEAVRLLTREAITWQTTRARQLLSEVGRSTQQPHAMPGRLRERLAEAAVLADLPTPLATAAGIEKYKAPTPKQDDIRAVASADWAKVPALYAPLRKSIETSLPSLLSASERERRQRLMLKLVMLVPREYAPGVRDGKIVVPLEYRESVAFTAQARQLLGELAPLWLAESDAKRDALDRAEQHLQTAEETIARLAPAEEVTAAMKQAEDVMTGDLGINLARRGTTADIVDEVMLETRTLLGESLNAALKGDWAMAESLRLEAYTTYDPELEARLMPRDPQLALDIEHLLLDGLDQPGVKVLLDRRAGQADLEAGYGRVYDGLAQAAALLKTGVSPKAAAINAASVVLREGLEGLLVIIAIFAGLRGAENARRRRLFWVGILASVAVTALTWLLSQTIMTSLRAYGEVIAAVTGIIAIATLLLITNWLFQQVYWKQWITTLKNQAAEGESVWALMTVGFAVGYREGFETVLFLQSLVLDAGTAPVMRGVAVGTVLLLALGIASLYVGLKLPYFKLLLVTAALIGLVLITFTGGTVRALQTVGWLPVHKFTDGSWPAWMGMWLGLYNTWESMIGQLLAIASVLGTWAVARWSAKRKSKQRRAAVAACKLDAQTDHMIHCGPEGCAQDCDQPVPVSVTISPNVRRPERVVEPAGR
ncbi:MAG TPA: hypothetical protein VF595_14200 [Tepidisphaeraceae bacterium]